MEQAQDDGKDDLSRGMDEWQLECFLNLRVNGQGHDRAWALAQDMRLGLEIGLRAPGPLIVVTGI